MTLKPPRARQCVCKFDECFRFLSSSEGLKTAPYNFSCLVTGMGSKKEGGRFVLHNKALPFVFIEIATF